MTCLSQVQFTAQAIRKARPTLFFICKMGQIWDRSILLRIKSTRGGITGSFPMESSPHWACGACCPLTPKQATESTSKPGGYQNFLHRGPVYPYQLCYLMAAQLHWSYAKRESPWLSCSQERAEEHVLIRNDNSVSS